MQDKTIIFPSRSSAIAGAAALVVTALLTSPASAQDVTQAIADAAGIPQIDAFLPDKYSVEESDALPIDGVWMISSIKKKIRIERGRAYAVDSWLHLFTLKVQPDMVVLQNFERTAPGEYSADDLPLLGPAAMKLLPDGNISVKVKGALGPASYRLIKRDLADSAALQSELYAMANGDAERAPDYLDDPVRGQEPEEFDGDTLANCQNIDVDPASGDVVCMD